MSGSGSGKSFFSSMPGVITGVAGLLSAVAAVGGLAVQQGWIGDSGSSDSGTVQTGRTNRGAEGANTGGGGEATSEKTGTFDVDPSSVVFQPVGSRDAEVKVSNTGDVPIEVESPTITGADADRFDADDGSCSGSLDPGRSCQLEVTFKPATGSFEAVLVVSADGAPKSAEVPIRGSAVL